MPLRRRGLRKSAARALSRRVRRMYARAGGLSNERFIRRYSSSFALIRPYSPLLSDRMRRAVQFLVQHALFVGG